MSNATFVVSSMYRCDDMDVDLAMYRPDPIWRTTMLGCQVLQMLQTMYQFNMTYVEGLDYYTTQNGSTGIVPDIYARPRPILSDDNDLISPTQAVLDRRDDDTLTVTDQLMKAESNEDLAPTYGFLLRSMMNRPGSVNSFFTLPFSRLTWGYLVIMVLCIFFPVLYLLSRWEKKVLRPREQEYSLTFELLIVVAACCQHVPPIFPILASRRLAYVILLFFTYIVYTYYASNLLSHLVSDKATAVTLTQLVEGDTDFVALDSMRLAGSKKLYWYSKILEFPQLDLLRKKLSTVQMVNVSRALTLLKADNVAVLSDFVTIYPFAKEVLDNEEICDLVEIDVFANIKEYIFTSKDFPLNQQFKVGMMRIIETGLLKRIKHMEIYSSPKCIYSSHQHFVFFHHVVGPVIVLAIAIAVSLVLLMLERAFYSYCERNFVFPFVN